jgi:hypothetical protein
VKKKKKNSHTKHAKGNQPVLSRVPPIDNKSKGLGGSNRVDARVRKSDLKEKGFPSSARLIDEGDVLFIQMRNDKIIDGRRRKVKCRTPTKPDNRSSSNLGRIMKEYPLVRLRSKGPLSGHVARILQQKTDRSFRILTRVQDLLVGTIFESKFFYHATAPYLRACSGKLLVSRKPSLGTSRLFLTQLLRVKSSFPWGQLESVFR